MASCVRNIRTKNYQNLLIGFQVTVENVGDVFLGHSVVSNNVGKNIELIRPDMVILLSGGRVFCA